MFTGFTPETIDFLWGIRMNNNRDWFLEHKKQYVSTLYEPMKALGKDLFAPFMEIPGTPDCTIPTPTRKVCGSASGRTWSGGRKIPACSLRSTRRA